MRQSEWRLSMNQPTPDPSQEGSRHWSASCPFPSWEGLGVGSWCQRMRKCERRLSLSRRSSSVVLGLLQTACSPDPGANLKKTLRAAERAARDGAQILCTQELFRSQYFCQSEDHKYFALAEPIPGPTTDAFRKLARKLEVVIIVSLFE